MAVVLGPLVGLDLEELVGDGAERALHHFVFAQRVERLGQRLRQKLNSSGLDLVEGTLVHVAQIGRARVQAALNAVEPSRQIGRQSQIGIGRGRDRAVFKMPLARRADHLRAVVVAIGDKRRRPSKTRTARIDSSAELQALVTVDRRAGDRAQGAGMVQNAAEEVVGQRGAAQAPLVAFVQKEILARLGVGQMVVRV